MSAHGRHARAVRAVRVIRYEMERGLGPLTQSEVEDIEHVLETQVELLDALVSALDSLLDPTKGQGVTLKKLGAAITKAEAP